jgi:hypothetical protein
MVLRTHIMVFWVMTSSSLELKIGAHSTRTVVTTYPFTLCHNQEDQSMSNNEDNIWGSHDVDCEDHIFRFVTLCSVVEFYCLSIVRVTIQDIGKFLSDYTTSYPRRHIVLKECRLYWHAYVWCVKEKRILSVWCFHFCVRWLVTMVCDSLTWLHVTATVLTTTTVM